MLILFCSQTMHLFFKLKLHLKVLTHNTNMHEKVHMIKLYNEWNKEELCNKKTKEWKKFKQKKKNPLHKFSLISAMHNFATILNSGALFFLFLQVENNQVLCMQQQTC